MPKHPPPLKAKRTILRVPEIARAIRAHLGAADDADVIFQTSPDGVLQGAEVLAWAMPRGKKKRRRAAGGGMPVPRARITEIDYNRI